MSPSTAASRSPATADPCRGEAAAVAFLEGHRWGDTPRCPNCHAHDVYAMQSQAAGSRNKRFLWRCRACGKQYTVRTGTVLEESLLPLHVWCRVVKAASETETQKPLAALQIAEAGDISHKTALYLLRRLRAVLPGELLDDKPSPDNTSDGKRADIQPIRIRGDWRDAIVALLKTGSATGIVPSPSDHAESRPSPAFDTPDGPSSFPPGQAAIRARHSRSILALSEEDLAEALQIAMRLRAALRNVLEDVPKECRTPTSLSRYLNVERTIVQRLFSAFAGTEVTPHSLTKAPGGKAIRTIAEAVRAIGLNVNAERLIRAVSQLETFFSRVGGTQRAYADLLLLREAAGTGIADPAPPSPRASSLPVTPVVASVDTSDDPHTAERRVLYEAARNFVGRWSKTQIQMLIYPPSATAPDMHDTIRIRGVIGTQWKASASQLMFLSMTRPDSQTRILPPIEPLVKDTYAIPEFSSHPTPLIQNEPTTNAQYYLVSHPSGASEHPMDVILADKTYSAGRLPTRRLYWSVGGALCEVVYPAESLIFDVYHHRDFRNLHIPGIEAHLLLSNAPHVPAMEWTTKLGIPLTLRSFPASRQACASPYYDRMGDLAAHTFEHYGADMHDYICYRFEITYPHWRLGYRMLFDYQPLEALAKEEPA